MSDSASKKILALIPARGGSMGVPRKNIREFCGKPLIAYTIEAARNSGVCDRIVVSTDDTEIAAVAKTYGAEVPFLRPAELATSTANVVDAAIHMLDALKASEGYEPDVLVLLQPTSPLRDAEDIVMGIRQYEREGAPALVSVCLTHHQTLAIVDGRLVVRSQDTHHVNRQELEPTYKQDGSMLYIIDVPYFREHRTFLPEGATAAYVIPKWKAVDIDEEEDWKLAEVLYTNRDSF